MHPQAAKQARAVVHALVSAVLVAGWIPALASGRCTWLAAHAGVCALTVVHWRTNGGRCFLSQYDYGDRPNAYTRDWLQAVLGHDVGERVGCVVSHALVMVPMLVSMTALAVRC